MTWSFRRAPVVLCALSAAATLGASCERDECTADACEPGNVAVNCGRSGPGSANEATRHQCAPGATCAVLENTALCREDTAAPCDPNVSQSRCDGDILAACTRFGAGQSGVPTLVACGYESAVCVERNGTAFCEIAH